MRFLTELQNRIDNRAAFVHFRATEEDPATRQRSMSELELFILEGSDYELPALATLHTFAVYRCVLRFMPCCAKRRDEPACSVTQGDRRIH